MPSKKFTKKFKGWNNNYESIIPARYLHSGVLQEHPSSSSSSSFSSSSSLLWVFGGETADYLYKNDLYSIDTESGYGRKITPSSSSTEIPEARDSHSAVVVDDREMLIFSGNNDNDDDNDLFRFNFETMEWHKMEKNGDVPSAREGHSAIIHNSSMIIFGGVSLKRGKSKTFLNDIFSFNTDSKEWKKLSTKGFSPEPRKGHSAVVSRSNGTMIIFGGSTYAAEYLNNVAVLDLYTNDWETLETRGSIPSGREHHSAVINSSGDQMYIFGGWSQGYASNELYEFDIDKKIWNKINIQSTRTITPRYGHSAVLQGTKMYIIGGRDQRMMLLGDLLEYSLEELSDDEEEEEEEEEENDSEKEKFSGSKSYQRPSTYSTSSTASPRVSSDRLSVTYPFSLSSSSYFDSPRKQDSSDASLSPEQPISRSPLPSFSSSSSSSSSRRPLSSSHASRTLSFPSFDSTPSDDISPSFSFPDELKDDLDQKESDFISRQKSKSSIIEPIKTENIKPSPSVEKQLSPEEKESFDRFDDFDPSKFEEHLSNDEEQSPIDYEKEVENEQQEEKEKEKEKEEFLESKVSKDEQESEKEKEPEKHDDHDEREPISEEANIEPEQNETEDQFKKEEEEDIEITSPELKETIPKDDTDTEPEQELPRETEDQKEPIQEKISEKEIESFKEKEEFETLSTENEKREEHNQTEEPHRDSVPMKEETLESKSKSDIQESEETLEHQSEPETLEEPSRESSWLKIPEELNMEDVKEVEQQLTNINQSKGAHEFIIFTFSTQKKYKHLNYLTLIGTGTNGFIDIKSAVSSKSYCFIVYRLNKHHLVHLPWIPSKLKPSHKPRSEAHLRLFSEFIHSNCNIDGEFVINSKKTMKEKHIKSKLKEQKEQENKEQQNKEQETEYQEKETTEEKVDEPISEEIKTSNNENENENETEEYSNMEKEPHVIPQEVTDQFSSEEKENKSSPIKEESKEEKPEFEESQEPKLEQEQKTFEANKDVPDEKESQDHEEQVQVTSEMEESQNQENEENQQEQNQFKEKEIEMENEKEQKENEKENEQNEKEQKEQISSPEIKEPKETKPLKTSSNKSETEKVDQDLESLLKSLRDDSTEINWIAVTYEKKKTTPIILGSGSGGIQEATQGLREDQYAFVLVQVMLNESGYGMIPKMLMITWIGPHVKAMQKAQCTRNSITFTEEVKRVMEIHRQVHADSLDDLQESAIKTKLAGGKVEASEPGTTSSTAPPRFGGGKMQLQVLNEDEAIGLLKDLGSSSSKTRWVMFSEFEKNGNCRATAHGIGGLDEWRSYLENDDYCFIIVRVTEGDTSKNVFVKWVGPDLEGIRQAKSSGHHTLLLQFVKKHASIGSEFQANQENLSEDKIRMKVFGSGRVTDTPQIRTDLTPSEQWAQRKRASTGLVAESAGKFRRPKAPRRKSAAPRRRSAVSVLNEAESEDNKTRVEANDFEEAEKHMKEVMEVTQAGTGEGGPDDGSNGQNGVNVLGGGRMGMSVLGRKPGMPKGGGHDPMSMFGGANMKDILAKRENLRKSKTPEENNNNNNNNNNNDNNGNNTNSEQDKSSSTATDEKDGEPTTPETPKKKKKKKKTTGKTTKKKKKKSKE